MISFETANRLKEAGFEQPEPQAGQFWYDRKSEEILVVGVNHYTDSIPLRYLSQNNSLCFEQSALVFAPTATDILARLPPSYALHRERINGRLLFYVFSLNLSWVDGLLKKGWKITDHAYHENAVEAGAIAWLKRRESQPETDYSLPPTFF